MAAAINTYTCSDIFHVTVTATGEQFYAMPSGTNNGSCYTVKEQQSRLVCSCPDCMYRKRDCKHIRALVAHLDAKHPVRFLQVEYLAAWSV